MSTTEPPASLPPTRSNVEPEPVKHRLSVMTDTAENPGGLTIAEWGAMFPPNLVRAMLRVCAATVVYTEPPEGFDDVDPSTLQGEQLDAFDTALSAQWDEMTEAVEEWQTQLSSPVAQYRAAQR